MHASRFRCMIPLASSAAMLVMLVASSEHMGPRAAVRTRRSNPLPRWSNARQQCANTTMAVVQLFALRGKSSGVIRMNDSNVCLAGGKAEAAAAVFRHHLPPPLHSRSEQDRHEPHVCWKLRHWHTWHWHKLASAPVVAGLKGWLGSALHRRFPLPPPWVDVAMLLSVGQCRSASVPPRGCRDTSRWRMHDRSGCRRYSRGAGCT